MLCENFRELRVHKFLGKEYERFHQIVFLGIKQERQEAEQMAKGLSEYMLNPENIPPITQLPTGCYAMPPARKKVELFKGAVFNVTELADQLKKSPSIEKLFESRALDNRERRPLLPLNLSQVGLVGASGMMNGLVQCDTPHIIKGRIVKEKKTKIGNDGGKTTVREITSNRLVFNVLTPSGMKSLG